MLKRLYHMGLAAALLFLAGWAGADVPVEALISGRAAADYAEALPDGAEIEVLAVSPRVAAAQGVAEFWMEPASGRFLANLIVAGGVQRVSGVMQYVQDLPVPVRRLMPGETIAASDLVHARVPMASVGTFAIGDAKRLAGMEVRRMLEEGRPIMEQSVTQPMAVARGSRVTILFQQGAMRLSAPGRALGDARTGEDIRVVNLSSNKTITGVARGDGVVEVIY